MEQKRAGAAICGTRRPRRALATLMILLGASAVAGGSAGPDAKAQGAIQPVPVPPPSPEELYKNALSRYRPLAEQGDAKAQYELGGMYDAGHGVPQDHVEAVRWFRKAADQGFADAQDALARAYFN